MSEYIEVGQPLQFTDPNTPTRVGEIVESVSDIYNIPSPRLGMQVFVKSEKKSFVITSLKSKVIGGVDVPEAAVETFEPVGAKSITWNNDTDPSNMNDFVVAGVYDIKGERTRIDDNLPILNTGGGHSFNARLTVLDSSISGDGKNDDKCITQVMSFNNRLGQGEVYIRTGKGASLDSLTWENWSTLQRNVNVGEVQTLDNLIDNGIYSGVYVGTGSKFTFVMVVINDYALAEKLGADRVVNQFLYAVEVGGHTRYTTRKKIGYAPWSNEEILNKSEIDSMIKSSVDNAIKGVIADAPEAFDTLKEIADWIANDETGAVALANAISANAKAINTEVTRAKDEEQKLNTAITEEATRAKNKENELATTINIGLDDLEIEFTKANNNIKANAMQYNTLGVNVYADKAEIYGRSIDSKIRTVDFPAATIEKAGVMSAADKDKLNNSYKSIDVSPNEIDVELDIEDNTGNTYHIPFPAATTEMSGVMSSEDKKALNNSISGEFEIEPVDDGIAINYSSNDSKSYATVIPYATKRYGGVMSAEDKKEQVKMTPLLNGDTIVGQAREIHSRNGKTVSDSFLARTTAGSGTIGDGVASLKSVGGNIVKNLVSGYGTDGWVSAGGTAAISQTNGIYTIQDVKGAGYCTINWKGLLDNSYRVNGHAYYYSCNVKAKNIIGNDVVFGIVNNTGAIYNAAAAKSDEKWQSLSFVTTANTNKNYYGCALVDIRTDRTTPLYAKDFLCIDLTEMFGAGNEPTLAECDRLFATMDALPQGLTIANPSTLKSIGFNQFNPENVLEGKAIVDNAIVSGDKKIAVIPCLPCKVGVGENNGYCIHGDFGEDIKVYLTPLNPMEVEGELFMHELTKDATTDTYVPQIKGYMLVEVPTTANLCAHFLWSEDKCERDSYEPYFESKVELPTIPEMSEWGLAGIQSSGTLACDEIDFERGVYVKRIDCVDMGSFIWLKMNFDGMFYSNNIRNVIKKPNSGVTCNAITANWSLYKSQSSPEIHLPEKNFMVYKDGVIYVKDTTYTNTNALKAALQGVMLYYELAEPIEYSLPKVDNNYISSDYGVEQFDSNIPCSANNLYYMRSLAGETRNFLDRLMAGLGTSDATVVADRILAVVNPAPANVEPETPIEI